MTKYYVSRQRYWPEGNLMVEIAMGGLDMANPDMMITKFSSLGEGKEYRDPIKAVEAGIRILNAWREANPEEEINIGYGFTAGNTIPFEPSTIEELEAWAQKKYDEAPKCMCCGELEELNFTHDLGGDFCSQYCAEKDYNNEVRRDLEETTEEE